MSGSPPPLPGHGAHGPLQHAALPILPSFFLGISHLLLHLQSRFNSATSCRAKGDALLAAGLQHVGIGAFLLRVIRLISATCRRIALSSDPRPQPALAILPMPGIMPALHAAHLLHLLELVSSGRSC